MNRSQFNCSYRAFVSCFFAFRVVHRCHPAQMVIDFLAFVWDNEHLKIKIKIKSIVSALLQISVLPFLASDVGALLSAGPESPYRCFICISESFLRCETDATNRPEPKAVWKLLSWVVISANSLPRLFPFICSGEQMQTRGDNRTERGAKQL